MVPCTTTHRGLPSHVELDPEATGLGQLSNAKCEDVKSVCDQRLITRLGAANELVLFGITRALRFLLDF